MSRQLVHLYRTGDDYRRYSWENPDRRSALKSFSKTYSRYIGRSVLDLGCGGGVLAGVLAPTGRLYVGVDANPDMIREARQAVSTEGFAAEFIRGDITRSKIPGIFDTVTLIGNAMAHFTIADMDRLLRVRSANVRPGSTFIVDYRDLIAMFWQDTWTRVKVQTHVRGKVVHRARLLDLEKGRLSMQARPSSRKWVLDWSHAIWSPFILGMVMRHHGWMLRHRSPPPPKPGVSKIPENYLDVYRLEATRA